MYWLHPSSKSLGIFSPFHPQLCIFLYFNSNILSLVHFLYFLIKLFFLPIFFHSPFHSLSANFSLSYSSLYLLSPPPNLFLNSFTTLFFSPLYPLLLSTFRLYALFLRPLFSLFLYLSHTSIFSIIPISLLLFLPLYTYTLLLPSLIIFTFSSRPSASSIFNYLFSLSFFFFIFDNLHVTAPFSLLIFFQFLPALISLSPFSCFFSLIFLPFLFLVLQPTVRAP